MLRRTQEMEGMKLVGVDESIGKLHDFYFDDDTWIIRYLVAETGPWLFGRKILIAPQAITGQNWEDGEFETELTQEDVNESPDISLNEPVSRQHEIALHDYYSWPYYWTPSLSGLGSAPTAAPMPIPPTLTGVPMDSAVEEEVEAAMENARDPHLRSVREVTGYTVEASDGDAGSVTNFFVDTVDWTIRYLVVDTGRWLPGKKVLVAPAWLERISWPKHTVHFNMTRAKIEQSPEYNPMSVVDRAREEELYAYYGFPGYWLF